MYGQSGRKTEVKLVRLSQYDRGKGYVGGSGRQRNNRRRTLWKSVAIVLAVCVLVAAGFFVGMHFVAGNTPQESVAVNNLPAEPEVADTGAEDIVLPEEPRVPLVAIDPGHGGEDEGCIYGGVKEQDVNLEIAFLLAEKLREMDIDVVLTRDNETWPSLAERVEVAEQYHADVYVSIHQNSYDDASIEGIETWYSSVDEDNRRLAELVNMGALEATDAKSRELVVTEELLVIRETSMPSCLIETGFLSNAKEREALCDPAYQEKLADGIAWGIYNFLYPQDEASDP